MNNGLIVEVDVQLGREEGEIVSTLGRNLVQQVTEYRQTGEEEWKQGAKTKNGRKQETQKLEEEKIGTRLGIWRGVVRLFIENPQITDSTSKLKETHIR